MKKSDKWSGLPPVQKIHLPEKHMVLRVVLLTAAIIVAAVSLVKGLTGLLNQDPGWHTIEAQTKELSYSQEFVLQYDLGGRGASASVENRTITTLYSDLMEQAYVLFAPSVQSETVHNLRYVSDHPNETLTVEPVLYEALAKVKAYESRYLYLAPAYVEQSRIFRFAAPEEAESYDPARNPKLRPYMQQLASFAGDPKHIDLEILPDNQVILHVSQEYLDFVRDNEIEYLLDFAWMRNAFLVDWVADELERQGFLLGSISSIDGYSRNLDPREMAYSYNLFDRQGDMVNIPGALQYQGPMSFALLRDFPVSPQDKLGYMVYPDRQTSSMLLDPADGLCRSSVSNLLLYDEKLSCADLALMGAPLFITETLDEQAVRSLPAHAIWGAPGALVYTQPDAELVPGANADGYEFRCAEN